MEKKYFLLSVILFIIAILVVLVQAKVIRDAIWCHDELYGVTLTPQDVPNKGPFDKLYNFADSGLDGQRSVSESCPGDTDYNGGRWEVIPVTFTSTGKSVYDPDGDGDINMELKSADEVLEQESLGHLVLGPPARYFVCPLHPEK